MEGIIAECGEKDRIGKFVDEVCSELNTTLTEEDGLVSSNRRYQLVEDIYEKLNEIINHKYDINNIIVKYFPKSNKVFELGYD